jgi:hypothetical protein
VAAPITSTERTIAAVLAVATSEALGASSAVLLVAIGVGGWSASRV